MTTPNVQFDLKALITLIMFSLFAAFTAVAASPQQTFSHEDLTNHIAPLSAEADFDFLGGGTLVNSVDSIQDMLNGTNEYFAHMILILLVGSVVFVQTTRQSRSIL